MHRRPATLVVLTAVSVLVAGGGLSAQRGGGRRAAIAARVSSAVARDGSTRVIVRLRSAFTPEGALGGVHRDGQRRGIRDTAETAVADAERGGRRLHRLKRFLSVPLLSAEVDADQLDRLAASGAVAEIFEDVPALPTLAESAPMLGAPAAAARGYDGGGWSVAVLDTGVDKRHPFLAGKVIAEACFSTTSTNSTSLCPGGVNGVASDAGLPCALDGCEHGTHVAGIVAGRGGSFSGIAPGASIVSIDVFTRFDRSAGCPAYPCIASFTSDEMLGLEQVYAMRDVWRVAAVNMSLGGGSSTTACDSNPMKPIIDQLRSVGIPTVISSGNNSLTNALSAPACISSAVSVGSIDDGSFYTTPYAVSNYSNSAPFLTLLAPGRWITSSVPGGGYATYSGTSMAAPHVAGAFAAMRSALPAAGVDDILAAWTRTGRPIADPRNGVVTPLLQLDQATRPEALAGASLNDAAGRPVLLWQNSQSGAVEAWRMRGTARLASEALPSHPGTGWNLAATGDFDHDGQRDLVWQNLGLGTVEIWLMNGASPALAVAVSPGAGDVNWQIAAVADMNGDGDLDVIWQHQTQGYLKVWLMHGTARQAEVPLDPPRVADANWKIAGVADLNGDGKPDLLWQHLTQGWLFVSFMNGTVQTSSEYLSPAQVLDPAWRLSAVVDSDGDGRSNDLLWQHSVTGQLVVWRMDGRRMIESIAVTPEARSAGWHLPGARYAAAAAPGDVDGDGKPDLLLANTATGRLQAWLMDGARLRQRLPLDDEAPTSGWWEVVGFGDMNGDGRPDLVWQDINGWLSVSIMNGGRVTQRVTPSPQQEPDSNWRIVAVADVDGDGQNDLIWQHRTRGEMRVWYMNGVTRIGTAAFSTDRANDPNWRIVGAADVDGDGKPDFIWWHPIDGWLTVWYMDGTTRLSMAYLSPERVANTDWQPVAVADFNRDGHPDIVWQQRSTGALQLWNMNGERLFDSVWLAPAVIDPSSVILAAR